MLEWGFLGWNSVYESLGQEKRNAASWTASAQRVQGWRCLRLLLFLSLISGMAQHYLARKLACHHLFHSCHSLSLGRSTVAVLFWVVLHSSFGQIALGLCTRVQLQQFWEEKPKLNQRHLAQVPSLTKRKKSSIKMPRTAAFRRV